MRLKLTDLAVRALPPSDGQLKVWDTVTKGFGVRMNGASKSWIVMYGKDRKLKVLGHYPATSLADARRAAKEILLSPDDRPDYPLFADAAAQFLETQDHLAPLTMREYARILKTRFEPEFKFKRINDVDTRAIARILDCLSPTPGERKYAHSVIRRFFKWAVGRRMVDRSPVDGLDIPKSTPSRERVLTADELKSVWKAADGMGDFGAVIRLCITTGQRRGQIAALRGEWIDREHMTISWPSTSTKQKKQHVIPIGRMTLELLPKNDGLLFPARDRDTPLNGWSKATASLIKRASVAHFVPHDLRRTALTMWAQLRIDRDVREFLLGHTLKGIEGVYDRWDRMEPMRDAIVKWEAKLSEIVAA